MDHPIAAPEAQLLKGCGYDSDDTTSTISGPQVAEAQIGNEKSAYRQLLRGDVDF
jgi:hypothetical protein